MRRTTKPAPARRLGLQTLRGAWQRLSMVLLLMMLTTMTAWAQGVDYIDANGVVKNTATDDIVGNDNHTVLTGNETHLSAGWYVVNSDITYTGTVTLGGDVTIILCNGKTMNIGTSTSEGRVSGSGIYGSGHNLTIYGQTLDEGTAGQLRIYISSYYSSDAGILIFPGTYTQHSGNVTINSFSNNSINVYGNITINGGKLDATATAEQWNSNDVTALACSNNITMSGGILNATGITSRSSYSANGIHGTVTMTGGTLTASGTAEVKKSIGIEGAVTFSGGTLTASATSSTGSTTGISGNVSLSWTSAADRFTASSYNSDYTVTIADGQAFTTDGTDIYSGTLSSDDKTSIAGKTLQPLTAVSLADDASNTTAIGKLAGVTGLSVTLSGRTLYKDGNWNTLCLPFAMTAEQIAASPLAGADIRALSATIVYDEKTTGFDPANGILTLNFTPAAPDDGAISAIQAGVPYIVKWEKPENYTAYNPETPKAACSDIVSPVFTGVTVSNASTTQSFDGGRVQFIGTYSPETLTGGDWSNLYLGSGSTLYWPSSNKTINAFRGYFHLEPDPTGDGSGFGVRAFNLNFGDDDATGIVSIENGKWIIDNGAGAGWYDLSGRKLQGKPTAKGLYINNGKKVVIK